MESGGAAAGGRRVVRLAVMRRPVRSHLESVVEMRMPSGGWGAFTAAVVSPSRSISYEQKEPPHIMGEILLDELLELSAGTDEGKRVLQLYTRHKVLDLRPPPRDFPTWQLRLHELLMTRESVVHSGYLHKVNTEASQARGGGWTSRAESIARYSRYWFVLYSNGVLLYFTDAQSAHLGQARGFLRVEDVHQKVSVRRKLISGDQVRVIYPQRGSLSAVVISARAPAGEGSPLKFRVQLSDADTEFEANAAALHFWFDGAGAISRFT